MQIIQQKNFQVTDYIDRAACLQAKRVFAHEQKLAGNSVLNHKKVASLMRKGGIGTNQPDEEYWTDSYLVTIYSA